MIRIFPSNVALQDALVEGLDIRLGTPVGPIGPDRTIDGVAYDVVVVGTEAPVAAKILPAEWGAVLQKVRYHAGTILVHRDPALLPAKKSDWRTYNVNQLGAGDACELTVWLCSYLGIPGIDEHIFETWNARQEPKKELIIREVPLHRCVVDATLEEVWPAVAAMQGRGGVYLCGAYAVPGMGLLEQATYSAEEAVAAVHRDLEAKR